MDRFDIVIPRPRKNTDKPYWHKIGVAFASERGGFDLHFDSLPVPDPEGRVRAKMFIATPREGASQGQSAPAPSRTPDGSQGAPQGSYGDDLDDELPPF